MQIYVTLDNEQFVALIDSGYTNNFVCGDVGICIADKFFTVDCYSIALDKWDMILGITFLRTLGPILWDFDDLCMAFTRGDRQLFWRGIGSTRHDVQSTRRLATIHSEPAILDKLLQSFDDVFAAPQGLPPARPCDHRIHLLPNAAPVAVCPYRYPQL
jgi:hypothetical protein